MLCLSIHFFLCSNLSFPLPEYPTNFDEYFSNQLFTFIIFIFLFYGILTIFVLSNSMLKFLYFYFQFVSLTFFFLRLIVFDSNFFVGFVGYEKYVLRMLWMFDFHNFSNEVKFDLSSFVHPFHG